MLGGTTTAEKDPNPKSNQHSKAYHAQMMQEIANREETLGQASCHLSQPATSLCKGYIILI